MKTLPLIASVIITLLAAGSPAGAQANDSSSPPPPNLNEAMDQNLAIQAMNSTKIEIRRITALITVASIVIVDVSTLDNRGSAFRRALASSRRNAREFQNALQANPVIMTALTTEDPSFDIKSVRAADVRRDGSELVIYTEG